MDSSSVGGGVDSSKVVFDYCLPHNISQWNTNNIALFLSTNDLLLLDVVLGHCLRCINLEYCMTKLISHILPH